MAWNLDSLRQKLTILEQQAQSVLNDKERSSVLRDIMAVKLMINRKVGYSENKNFILYNMDYDQYLEDLKALERIIGDCAKILYNADCFDYVSMPKVLEKVVPNSEYDKLLTSFFRYIDPSLFALYQKYKEQSRIDLNSLDYQDKLNRGVCFYLLSECSSYVCADFNGKLKYSTALPHEFGHALCFEGQTDVEVVNKIACSIFTEAVSIFLELAFSDFLKLTQYSKVARYNEAFLLNQLVIRGNIQYTKKYNHENASHVKVTQYDGRAFISGMLAMYWYSIYRENHTLAKEEINKFLISLPELSQEEMFGKYPIGLLIEGVNSTFDNYQNHYGK